MIKREKQLIVCVVTNYEDDRIDRQEVTLQHCALTDIFT